MNKKEEVKLLSRVWLFVTPWAVAYQAPLSTEFSRQEYWSGLPFPSPGDLPDPGIEPRSPALQADALPSEPPGECIQYKVHSKYGSNMCFLHYLSLHKKELYPKFRYNWLCPYIAECVHKSVLTPDVFFFT